MTGADGSTQLQMVAIESIEFERVDDGDGGFDVEAAVGQPQPESADGVGLDRRRRCPLAFNGDGPAGRIRDENVQTFGAVMDHADRFSPDEPARRPEAPQDFAQGDIDFGFTRAGH